MIKINLFVLVMLGLLVGCTATGPADDGYDRDNEWVDNGRLFSDEQKVIYRSPEKSTVETKINAAAPKPGVNSNTVADYASYQQWQDAKDNNTEEYQKFLKWKEFEEFQRWKVEQQ